MWHNHKLFTGSTAVALAEGKECVKEKGGKRQALRGGGVGMCCSKSQSKLVRHGGGEKKLEKETRKDDGRQSLTTTTPQKGRRSTDGIAEEGLDSVP